MLTSYGGSCDLLNVAVDLLDFRYLHDISHDDTVYKFWCHAPCSEGSFGCMLSQVRCTVIPQYATIGAEWSALCTYNKYTCRETEHFSTVTRTLNHPPLSHSQITTSGGAGWYMLQSWLTQTKIKMQCSTETNVRWINLDWRDKRGNYTSGLSILGVE